MSTADHLQHKALLSSLRLLFETSYGTPVGVINSKKRWELINRDEGLRDFFQALNEIGEKAWEAEADYLKDTHKEGMKRVGIKPSYRAICMGVINNRLPSWRLYGQAYKQAMQEQDSVEATQDDNSAQ